MRKISTSGNVVDNVTLPLREGRICEANPGRGTKTFPKAFVILSLALLAFAGCSDLYPPTPKPDYTIRVAPTPDGMVAIPPECPSWSADTLNPYDNQPMPQFGCATARNLALMVERPEDLVHGRDLGPSNAVTTVGAMRRYNNNQTRGLLDLDTSPDMSAAVTTAPSASSSMTGDVTGGAAPAAAAAAPAVAP